MNARSNLRKTSLAVVASASMLVSSLTMLGGSPAVLAQDAHFGTAAVTPADALMYVRANLHTDSDQWALADELIARSGIAETAGTDLSLSTLASEEPTIDGEAAFVLTSIDAGEDVDLNSVTGAGMDPFAMTSDIPSGFSLIIQPTDVDAVAAELQDSVDTTSSDLETSEYGGVTITYAPPLDEFSDGYAYAQVNDTTLVVATIPDDIEPIIDAANGDVDPLSGDDDFTTVQDSLTTDSILFGFVDGAAIVDQALALAPDAEQALTEEQLAQADAIAGFSVYADPAGFRFDSVSIPGEAGLPAVPNFDPTLASRVPADTLLFANSAELGASGVLDSLAVVLGQALLGESSDATPAPVQDPDAYAEEVFAQLEQQLGFNIKTDFIDRLVGEYALSVRLNDITAEGADLDAIAVSGVDDATTVNDVLSKISFLAASFATDGQVASRDLGGTTIYQINAGDETFPLLIEFGVVGDELLIGVNDGIDQYLEGPTEPLADAENYQTVFSSLPEPTAGIAFVNVPALLPIIDSFVTSFSTSSVPDADPSCGEYDSQEDAQEAYETDFDFNLDLDFDGEACEDYFSTASPVASPASVTSALNVLGIGMVAYESDGNLNTSTLIAIGE